MTRQTLEAQLQEFLALDPALRDKFGEGKCRALWMSGALAALDCFRVNLPVGSSLELLLTEMQRIHGEIGVYLGQDVPHETH